MPMPGSIFRVGEEWHAFEYAPTTMVMNGEPIYRCTRGHQTNGPEHRKLFLFKLDAWIASEAEATADSTSIVRDGIPKFCTVDPVEDITQEGDVRWGWFENGLWKTDEPMTFHTYSFTRPPPAAPPAAPTTPPPEAPAAPSIPPSGDVGGPAAAANADRAAAGAATAGAGAAAGTPTTAGVAGTPTTAAEVAAMAKVKEKLARHSSHSAAAGQASSTFTMPTGSTATARASGTSSYSIAGADFVVLMPMAPAIPEAEEPEGGQGRRTEANG
jgi:hypothetical protein